jgi:PAB1-binding protein PBP1
MRILPIAAVLALLGSAAVAQNAPKGDIGAYGPDAPDKAFGGPVPEVYPGPGLDKVGPDGISTKVVKAVPCSTAARETDGTTTCIGIPGPIGRSADSREGTTTGMSRR